MAHRQDQNYSNFSAYANLERGRNCGSHPLREEGQATTQSLGRENQPIPEWAHLLSHWGLLSPETIYTQTTKLDSVLCNMFAYACIYIWYVTIVITERGYQLSHSQDTWGFWSTKKWCSISNENTIFTKRVKIEKHVFKVLLFLVCLLQFSLLLPLSRESQRRSEHNKPMF